MSDNRSDAQKRADLVRRDLKHADARRQRASELDSMVDWIGSGRKETTLLVRVPEHTSMWGTRHKQQDLTLSEKQISALQTFLTEEANRLRHHADSIDNHLAPEPKETP